MHEDLRATSVPAPVLPRYGRDWIGAVVPAVIRGEEPAWLPRPIRGARTVVLLVLDGLGWAVVRRFAAHLPQLSAMEGAAITSVVPTTTSAGLTSIATGAAPAVHGLVGYRTRIGGQMVNTVKWTSQENGPVPDPAATQPVTPFLGRAVPLVNRAEFRDSGFSAAHLRGGVFRGWSTSEELVDGIVDEVRRAGSDVVTLREPGERVRLVYAYDDRVDKAAHAKGLSHADFVEALTGVDAVIAAVLDRLPGHAALLVTADHGQLHADPSALVSLEAVVPLSAMMGGEARFRTVYAAAGAHAALVATARASYGDVAWVMTREELATSGWLGGRPSMAMSGRLGDVTLVAKGGYGFVDPDFEQEAAIKSMHGSVSEDEMLVPLLAARGRR